LESSRFGRRLADAASEELHERDVIGAVRKLGRNVAVACGSALVVGLLAAYAFAAPTVKLNVSFGAAVPRPGTSALVAGRVVAPDGNTFRGARIEVWRSGRLVAAQLSDRTGQFRIRLSGRACATYTILLHAKAQGATVEKSARRRLCRGDALPIDAHLTSYGHFLWVPGPR
jgi:hypothetical protein